MYGCAGAIWTMGDMAEFLGGCVAGVASSVVRVWLCGTGRGVVIRGHRRYRMQTKRTPLKTQS